MEYALSAYGSGDVGAARNLQRTPVPHHHIAKTLRKRPGRQLSMCCRLNLTKRAIHIHISQARPGQAMASMHQTSCPGQWPVKYPRRIGEEFSQWSSTSSLSRSGCRGWVLVSWCPAHFLAAWGSIAAVWEAHVRGLGGGARPRTQPRLLGKLAGQAGSGRVFLRQRNSQRLILFLTTWAGTGQLWCVVHAR